MSNRDNAMKTSGVQKKSAKNSAKNKVHRFSVNMSYAECEDMYRHQIKYLVVTDEHGLRIQLPKQNMQKFVTPAGLKGIFVLEIDQNHKIMSIKPN